MPAYGDKAHWDAHYASLAEDDSDDWLQTYPVLRPILTAHLRPADAILIVGCGTSHLGEQLYDDGYRSIVGVDFSGEAIRRMTTRAEGRPGLGYREMDARALELPSASFDAVLDKSTLDAVLCCEDRDQAARAMLDEVARVLRPEGVFICVSVRPARNRLHFLVRPEYGWTADVITIPKMKIIEGGDEESRINWVYVLSRGR